MSTPAKQPRVSHARTRLANALLFNLSWFAIVVTQDTAVALAIVVLHLTAHVLLVGRDRRELLLIALVSLAGLAVDQGLFLSGVFTLNGQAALAPLWLSCLWPVFATTLLHAFASLHERPWLAALVGGVGGALSYIAGVHLSDVDFASPLWGPVIVGALWALLFPLLLAWAARLHRGADPLQAWEPTAQRAFD